MLLSIDLSQDPVQEEYQPLTKGYVFIGAIIKHLYDEKRIRLNIIPEQAPSRFLYKNPNVDHTTNLYGFIFPPKGEDHYLATKLKSLTKQVDVLSYNKVLQDYNYSCENNFLLLNKGIFPVDSHHIPKYIPQYSFSNIFSFSEEIPIFQQFTTIHMLFLI